MIKEISSKELKQKFIDQYSEDEKMAFDIVFKKLEAFEEQLNKDLCNLDINEIVNLLHNINANSIESIAGILSVLTTYTDFCITEGYTSSKINNYKQFSDRKMLGKYINQPVNENKYLKDKKELQLLKNICGNAQDEVLLALLWEGIMGTHKFDEIRNLKIEDVDFNNNEIHISGKRERIIKVEIETIESIKDAIEEKYYIENSLEQKELLNTPYVVRPIKDKKTNKKLTSIAIKNRINRISSLYENPYITPINIYKSGMIYYIKKIMQNKRFEKFNEVPSYMLRPILERYGIRYTSQNITKMRRQLKNYIDIK